MQYTVRGIPAVLDKAMRQRARARGKSLNELAIEALAEGIGLHEVLRPRRDLSDIVGTWRKDAAVEAALAAQDHSDRVRRRMHA
jgi:hypothetical protein